MPEIEIRTATTDDIESLSLFEHSYSSDYVWQMGLEVNEDTAITSFRRTRLPRRVLVPYPRQKEEIFKDIDQVDAFLVAVLEQRSVGYIKVLVEEDSGTVMISDLVVSAPMRRQGIASGLIYAAMDFTSFRQYFALMLEVQSKNDPAICMAKKLGLKYCGYRDLYFHNREMALFFSSFLH